MADLIFFIHILMFLSVVIIPFTNNKILVLINLLFMMLILLHWIVNNNVCALTIAEKMIRGTQDDDQTFFGNIFGKFYTFGKEERISWFVIIFLIIFSATMVIKDKTIQRIMP